MTVLTGASGWKSSIPNFAKTSPNSSTVRGTTRKSYRKSAPIHSHVAFLAYSRVRARLLVSDKRGWLGYSHMTTTIKTDVIVVGAGPSGLSLACQLSRYGIDFVVIEKNEDLTPYSKALGVHARTLEIYEQMGLARKAVEQGSIAGKVRLLEKGEILGEVDLSNIGEGQSFYPYMLVLEQSENERLLYDYLQSLGHDVLWRTELESFSQNDSGVTVKARNGAGEPRIIEGKYLVGCDGPKSPVRHALGLSFEGSTFERIFYVADVQIDWKFSHDALHVCLARNGVVAFFPMRGEKRWRIVGAFPEGHDKDEGEILYEEIEQSIKEEAELKLDISHVNWFSVYKV